MLSRISKMSVFGIVALMLVLGLTADDALAQEAPAAGTYAISVAYDLDGTAITNLRAAGTATVTFTLTVAGRENKDEGGTNRPKTPTAARTVQIDIPANWSPPAKALSGADADEAGEVRFQKGGTTITNNADAWISNGGRTLNIKIAEGNAGNGEYTAEYANATIPTRRGNQYRFFVRNADVTELPYVVDYAVSGSGRVSMGPFSPLSVKVGDPAADHAYNGAYVFKSKDPISPLRFTYTAAGSLPENAYITIAMANGFTLRDKPKSVVSVTGSGSPEISFPDEATLVTETATTLRATVKSKGGLGPNQSFTVTITGLAAPEVTTALDIDNTITVSSVSGNTTADSARTAVVLETPAVNVLKTGQAADAADAVRGRFDFFTTAVPGTGELAIMQGTDARQNTRVEEGFDLGTLRFDITGTTGMGPNAKFQIVVPGAPWPAPIKAPDKIGVPGSADTAGHVINGDVNTGARTISGSLTTNANPPVANTELTNAGGGITYRVGAISEHGKHEFRLLTSSGHPSADGGSLVERTGGGYRRYIEVTAKHGSGTFAVLENGVPLAQSKPAAEHTLQLVYTASGRMPQGTVQFVVPANSDPVSDPALPWKLPRRDNGVAPFEEGEVTFSNNATFTVGTDGVITATGSWGPGAQIIVTYRGKVPGAGDSTPQTYKFRARASSFNSGDPAVPNWPQNDANEDVYLEHTIGPNRAADGSGTLAIEPRTANASETIDLKITYKAAGTMDDGSIVEVTVPNGWPDLVASSVGVGVEGIAATLSVGTRAITATTADQMNADSILVLNVAGVVAPAVGGGYQFTAQSKSHGGLQSLTAAQITDAVVTVSERASGSAVLTLLRDDGSTADSVEPMDSFESAKIVFTAGVAMQPGAEVKVTIPDGWMQRPFEDNGMPRTSGEVTLEGKADLDVQGDVLVAKANAQINAGETVTFTYHMPMAPADPTTSNFETVASIVEGGGLLSVANQQTSVVVRSKVAALTLTADSATSVFVGESVTLTVMSDARAPVGGLSVSLATDPADTGMFSLTEDGAAATSVMIADSPDSMSTTFYYIAPSSIDMESVDVMLTATAMVDGEAVASEPVAVEVRSKISMLQVNGMDDPDPVEVGATITVTAIGEDADGSVTVTDADGAEVEGLVDLGLDPDASATDVPAGNVGHMREINLPDDLPEGMYTITLTIAGESQSIDINVVAARAAVTELTLTTSEMSFFAGGSITVTVAADARAPVGGLEVTLSTDPADSGMFSMTEGGDAVTMVMIPDSAETMSAMVYYTNAASGAVTLMAAAGDDLSASVEVMVNPTITVQVNGMDAPEGVQAGDTLAVTAMGKAGGGTVMVTDAAGDVVGSLTGLGLNVDADAEDVPEGSVAYMRDVELPADLADGTYMITVTIGSESATVYFSIETPPAEVDAIAISADPTSVFVGEEVSLNITLWSGADAANAVGDMVVMLTSSSDTSVLADSVTIADGENGVMTTFSDTSGGMVTITATSGDLSAEVIVEVKPTIFNYQINGMDDPGPLTAGVTLTITATGKEGKATVMVTNSDGDAEVPAKGLTGLDEEPDEDGNIAYTRDIDLPADLVDGMYTVTVAIAGSTADIEIEVINDQSPPALSNQKVLPDVVASGSVLTLSVDVSSNVPNPTLSVMADVSEIDADAAAVQLMKLPASESTYASIYVVQNSDPADDGMKTITFKATDRIGGMSEMTATTSLKNDVTPPVLSDAAAMPSPVVNGMDVTISVNGGESGLTVTADASAIGGDAAADLTEGMDENMAGTGMYSSMPITVSVSAGGDYTVSIKAVDGSGNDASMDVTVTVEVHEVTSVTFAPAKVSTGEDVTVTAMGSAGLTAMFNVFDADGMKIVDGKSMDESDVDGSYMGSFTVVVDMHPAGEYWVSASIGTADAMTADGSLTIDHEKHFTLSIGAGTHAIHIPLDVDGIDTVGDVYDMLGDSVNFIITFIDGNPVSYLGDESAGSMADAAIGDDTGLIAVMKSAATLELTGQALGTGGTSSISIAVGNNLVGVPLDPAVDMMISDAIIPGVEAIAVSNAAGDDFHTIYAAGDEGDGPLMGGVGYIVVASAAGSIPIVGTAWENDGAPMAAPGIAFSGSQTPVLHVSGGLIDEFDMLSQIPEISVTVKNLSTGASLDTVLGTEESAAAYSGTFVEFSRHAAKAGDVLEIVAHSPSPFVGVRPVPQIVVSAEEVLTSRISLPDLELYEIPSETELLANYPNPFNPETWIPYRLAKAAEVTLSIYDTNGALVRSIDVGFKPAAVYESRASAIYWDGRNNYGERVASGTYFYHLTAGEDYASTRRMVILK